MNKSDPFRKITVKQAVCTVLLLVEIATTVRTVYFINTLGIAGMSTGAIVSSTASLLCLVLGIFLFAGATAMQGKTSCFLGMAFLLHVLMACDCAGWYLEGHPEFNANQLRIMNLMLFLSCFLAPVCILMIRQLTGMGASPKELLKSRDRFDRVELIGIIALTALLLVLWSLNFSTGLLFSVSPEGRFVYGPQYVLFFAVGFAEELFGLVRLVRAKRPFRQILLFFLIFAFAAAGFLLDRYGVSVDISYALSFLLLFMIFSEFFAELRFANRRYAGVLETYVSGDAGTGTAGTETDGAGKEYNATVLLSDLRGFTAQGEHMSTEEIVEILNRYMGTMMEIIRENGGKVTEFLGDGLLCVFGAPEPAADHADRALKAAVRMQQAMEEINAWNTEHGYPVLRMGVGISTGRFTYGNIGTMRVARPMAVGKPVNEVFKAEMYALGGQIVITETEKNALKNKPLVVQEILHAPENGERLRLYQVLGFEEDPALLLKEKEELMYEPEKPVTVLVRRVDGKHIDTDPSEGKLLAISPQKAKLRLPQKPEPLQYICFKLKDRPESVFYARTPMRVTGNTVTVNLTAVPEDLESRYRELF